jgi:hypothetical protein
VEIHLEELVLYGFAPVERYRLAEAVERALVKLFTDEGAPPSLTQSRALEHLNAGKFEVAAGADAEGIGGHIAQVLYGGLAR